MNKETVTLNKEDVLNVISGFQSQLMTLSIDWISVLRALEKLEKTANKQLFGVNYDE